MDRRFRSLLDKPEEGIEQLEFCRICIAQLLPQEQKCDQEEMVQEALARYYSSPPEAGRPWQPYLLSIIQNLACDYLSTPNSLIGEFDDEIFRVQASSMDAICRLRNSHQRQNARNRLLVELDYQGKDYDEIAHQMGYTNGFKVKTQVSRLLKSGRYWDLWMNDDRLQTLQDAVQRGDSYGEIANLFNVSRATAQHLVKKYCSDLRRSSSPGEDAALPSPDGPRSRAFSSPSLTR